MARTNYREILEKAKEKLQKAEFLMAAKAPEYFYIYKMLRTIFTSSIPTMAVTDNDELLINPEFIMQITIDDIMFALCHEVQHIIKRHVQRAKEINADMNIFNIASDLNVNEELLQYFRAPKLRDSIVTRRSIEQAIGEALPQGLEKDVVESIYHYIKDKLPEQYGEGGGSSEGGGGKRTSKSFDRFVDGYKREHGDEVVNEGEKEMYDKDPEYRDWERVFREIKERIKQHAGRGKGNIIRKVQQAESKISWKTLLRYFIKKHINSVSRKESWYRVNRKIPYKLPGYAPKHTRLNIHCLLDVSGSISDNEFSQFIAEVFKIGYSLRNFIKEIIVSTWDDGIQDFKVFRASNINNIYNTDFHGGGGTSLCQALNEYLRELQRHRKRIQKYDIIIVFSDFELFDDYNDLKQIIETIRTKYRAVIIAVSSTSQIEQYRKLFDLAIRIE